MPVHDWSRVGSGTFHNFHVLWTTTITNGLNAGLLPQGYFAMAEQVIGGPEPDVIALKTFTEPYTESPASKVALAEPAVVAQPTTRFVMTADSERYAHKANHVVVRHELGRVHAIIEIISPGYKDSQHAIRSIVEKSVSMIRNDINLLIIDPFPPTMRDPQGPHQLIWNEFTDQDFELPPDSDTWNVLPKELRQLVE